MVGFPLLDLIRHRITVRRLAPVSTRSDHADRSMVAMALGVERRFAHALLNFGSVRYLVAPSRSGDLRQSAKHLFFRAMGRRSQPRVKRRLLTTLGIFWLFPTPQTEQVEIWLLIRLQPRRKSWSWSRRRVCTG